MYINSIELIISKFRVDHYTDIKIFPTKFNFLTLINHTRLVTFISKWIMYCYIEAR